MEAWLIGGFTLGLVSSLHCIGMCGPLAMALPIHSYSPFKKWMSLTSFHTGRIFTYSILGLLAGAAGKGLQFSGLQQMVTLTMGLLILLGLIAYYGYKRNIQPSWMNGFFDRLQQWMLSLLKSEKSLINFMLLGMANGLLPCGMVYVALAAAITASHMDQSSLFMLFFGLGTLPALLLVSFASHILSFRFRKKLQKAIPVFMALAAVLLVIRGLNLNIPYLSPKLQAVGMEVLHCGIVN